MSWDIFPFEADWYLSTWDYTQETYFPDSFTSKKEIDNIRHFFKHIEINNYEEYFTNFIIKGRVNPMFRSFKLLDSIRDIILSQKYERIIIFRPDLYFKKLEHLNNNDFEINNNTVRILGRHEPDSFYDRKRSTADDVFFVMPTNIFKMYSDLNYMSELNDKFNIRSDVHKLTFHFFDSLGCNVKLIEKIRSTIVRKDAGDYYTEHNNIDFTIIARIFDKMYDEKDMTGVGKFWWQFNKIIIHEPADPEKIRISQETGGILKLRKQ
jgi:hypothetical protein